MACSIFTRHERRIVFMNKIISPDNLLSVVDSLHSQDKKIVLVGGCFDILHEGHFAFLKAAKEQGDTLLVLLESDESVQKRKGENRPVNTQLMRAENLSQTPEVDYVLLLPHLKTDNEYYEMTNTIRPAIIAVTKNDPALQHKKRQADQVGGKVVEVIDRLPNLSTTDIINNI